LDNHSPHSTAGCLLRWDSTTNRLSFEIPPAKRNVEHFAAISLRVTQKVDSLENPPNQVQDFYLTLTDGNGKSRAIKVGKFGEIPPPQKRAKNQFTKSAMCTIRVPLHAFTIELLGADQVNLQDVVSLNFEFKATPKGEIEIDSIAFSQ
jgi:hypothetical protein